MGKRTKNSMVAAVAAGCILMVMGVVRIDGDAGRGDVAPPHGWQPAPSESLRVPAELPDASRDDAP